MAIRAAGEAERWNSELAALRSLLAEQPGGDAELGLRIRGLLDSGRFTSLGGRDKGGPL